VEILQLPCSSPLWMAAPFQLALPSYNCLFFKVTLQLVDCQSVCLGAKPLKNHDQRFFFQLNPCSQSLCNILSDEKMGLFLMNMLGLLSSVCIAHIACYWKFCFQQYLYCCKCICCLRLFVWTSFINTAFALKTHFVNRFHIHIQVKRIQRNSYCWALGWAILTP
jgi:hypothetical protein